MSKDQHSAQDFDRIFREKLDGHSVAPPAGMWENINANTQDSKQKRSLLWVVTNDTSIMLLILLLFIFPFAGSDFATSLAASKSSNSNRTIVNTSTSQRDDADSSGETSTHLTFDNISPTEKNTLDEPQEKSITKSNPSNADESKATSDGKLGEGDQKADSNLFSKRMNSSNSNSGQLAKPRVYEKVTPQENSNENVSDQVRAQNSNPADFMDDGENENSNPKAEIGSGIASENLKPSDINTTENTFKWRLMNVLKPNLSVLLIEDSLGKIPVPESPKDLVGTRDHEVFAGAHINFNLPLIFNQNTYGAFDGKELAYKPTFGLASGVRVGYTYKRQYGFQTGFIFYSRQGQDYDDKLNGNVAKRQVKLQYFHVPIILRYKFKIKKQQKFESPWVINLGTDIGILRSAQITYNGNEYPLGATPDYGTDMDLFRPIDVSVVLGVEKEFYFTKWLMLSVGMRTTFSGDINAEGYPVQNDGNNYDKSHNFTFGFTLGLNYYLRR